MYRYFGIRVEKIKMINPGFTFLNKPTTIQDSCTKKIFNNQFYKKQKGPAPNASP